jgi:kumamolisin
VPKDLAPAIVAVLGFDTRPVARPHFRVSQGGQGVIRPSLGAPQGFTPGQIAGLYQFPQGATGAGQCIALIELGGGFRPQDLQQYFGNVGVTSPPTVVAVPVGGTTNAPAGDLLNSPDGEVVLDIEVAGAVAPGAKIAVYFASNTDQGFADAVLAAVHDQTNQPTVISISWGSAEDGWTGQGRDAMNQAFQAAAAVGVSVFVAAGDNGSGDSVDDQQAHVDFPAASPWVVGCGGTSLRAAGGQITSETVWNDPGGGATGGGVSAITAVPSFQQSINPVSANPPGAPGRGVPDVAGDADPETGYQILGDDTSTVIGGTSAVAPLWAALIALIQQQVGRSVAPLLPALYSAPTAFHDITQGNNGAYSAGPGWDACTGLGSPVGTALVAALGGSAAVASAASGNGAKKKGAAKSATGRRGSASGKAQTSTTPARSTATAKTVGAKG